VIHRPYNCARCRGIEPRIGSSEGWRSFHFVFPDACLGINLPANPPSRLGRAPARIGDDRASRSSAPLENRGRRESSGLLTRARSPKERLRAESKDYNRDGNSLRDSGLSCVIGLGARRPSWNSGIRLARDENSGKGALKVASGGPRVLSSDGVFLTGFHRGGARVIGASASAVAPMTLTSDVTRNGITLRKSRERLRSVALPPLSRARARARAHYARTCLRQLAP